MMNRKNFSHELEPIEKNRYQKLMRSVEFSFQSEKQANFSEQKKTLNNHQEQQTTLNNHQNNDLEFKYFQLKNKIQLPKPSQAILLFSQNYQDILISNKNLKSLYGLKQIIIQFYSQDFAQQHFQLEKDSHQICQYNHQIAVAPLSITIRASQAIIFYPQSDPLRILFNKSILFHDFASNTNPYQLESKFWLQINKKLNRVALHKGDIQFNQNNKTLLFSHRFLQYNFKKQNSDWKHCQKSFDQITQIPKLNQKQTVLHNLTHCQILIKTYSIKSFSQNHETKPKKQQSLNAFHQNLLINMISLQTAQGPKIQQNPNLFHQKVSMISMLPSQIQTLYLRMKNMNLVTICQQYSHFKDFEYNLDQQLIGQSIHNSLITPFGYVINKKGTKIPIGILNHLLYLKTNKMFQSLISSMKLCQSPSQLYNHITLNRQGYIRFEIIHPHHFYPGNCGIIQIWPPFHSSPIHNHGQSMGMIKVIKAEVRIQNYMSLSCTNQKQSPYDKKDYRKGDYTWLSKDSYGIHRVINMTPQTSITLQAYYDHNQGSEEYFTFIKKQFQHKLSPKFTRYYPQHDWVNYLNMKSIQKEEDQNFIKQLINSYGLKRYNNKNSKQELDFSFGKFIQILLKQYYLTKSLLDEEDD